MKVKKYISIFKDNNKKMFANIVWILQEYVHGLLRFIS